MNLTKSSTLASTTTSSDTELNGKDTHQNTTKSGTLSKTSTMPPFQSKGSTKDTQTSPTWEKVEKAVEKPTSATLAAHAE